MIAGAYVLICCYYLGKVQYSVTSCNVACFAPHNSTLNPPPHSNAKSQMLGFDRAEREVGTPLPPSDTIPPLPHLPFGYECCLASAANTRSHGCDRRIMLGINLPRVVTKHQCKSTEDIVSRQVGSSTQEALRVGSKHKGRQVQGT